MTTKTTKKRLTKSQRDTQKKNDLRRRLSDMAIGAGIDDVEQENYWLYSTDSLVRLIHAVDESFRDQSVKLGASETILSMYFQLTNYESLETLTDWMFDSGYRA